MGVDQNACTFSFDTSCTPVFTATFHVCRLSIFTRRNTACARKPEKPRPHLHTSLTRLLRKQRIKAILIWQQWCCSNAYLFELISALTHFPQDYSTQYYPAPSALSKYGSEHSLDSCVCARARSSCDLIG